MRKQTWKYKDFLVKININKEVESLQITNNVADVESLKIPNSEAIVFHHLIYLKKILKN